MQVKDYIKAFISSISIMFTYPVLITIINGNYNNHFNFLLLSLIFIVILLIKKKEISKGEKILSIIFSLFLTVGEIFSNNLSLTFVFTYPFILFITIFKIFGYTYVIEIIFGYLNIFIEKFKLKDIKPKNKLLKKYIYYFDKYPFLVSFITIFIFWLIYLIAFYPMVLSKDPSYQILQYYNIPNKYADYAIQRDPNNFMTNHHPILLTYLLGFCIDFGRSILNDNFGLFIFTFIQTIIYISSLAYSIYFLKKKKINNKYLFILILIYSLVPMFPFYTIAAVKDTLYTAFMIYFVLFIYDIIDEYNNKQYPIKKTILLIIISILLSLLRNNGIYVVLMTLFILIIYLNKNKIKLSISLVSVFICILLFNKVLIPYLGVSDGSIREAMSVPFQNTARYVKYYDKDLSKKDKQTIDYILGYKDLAQRYDPDLSDPVKDKFNKYTTKEDLKKYFKVWEKGLKRHPLCYLDSFLNNTYGYIYPNIHKWYVYDSPVYIVNNHFVLNYHLNKFKLLRIILYSYAYIFLHIPVIGLISSIGFNTWILLFLTYYLIHKKKYKYLIVLVPLHVSLLFCFLGPANTYFRYAMPYIFILPCLIILFRGSENEKI